MSLATLSRPSVDTYRINVATEAAFRLEETASRLPSRRSGRPVARATLYSWAKDGMKGIDGRIVRLPTIRVGGTKCTTMGAIQWFFDQISQEPAERAAS